MGTVRRVLIVAGLLAPGCEDRPPLPPVVFEGEHIRYRTFEPMEDVCAGSYLVQDQKAGYLGEVFGTHDVVDFSWIPGGTFLDYCPRPDGCTIGGEVFSQRPVHEHELVHGVRDSSYLPLEEGLAVYFGDGTSREENEADTLETLLDPDVDGSEYARLGRFVSYIGEEYGPDELVRLADAVPAGTSGAELAAAVEDQLAVPLAQLVEAFDGDYPECPVVNFRVDAPFCQQPPALQLTAGVDAPAVEHFFALACDDPRTQGARTGRRWRYETIVVPERTAYLLTVAPEPVGTPAVVVLEPSGKSCFDDKPSTYTDFIDNEVVCLDEGTYLMRIALDGVDGGFHFSASPAGWC